MSYIDNFLNSITMYRLVLYGLTLLAVLGIVFGFTGMLPLVGWQMLVSLAVLIAAAWGSNALFGYVYKVPVNVESSYITAFILFLILPPPTSVTTGIIVALGAVLAMASKFILNIRRKHIFNPAAFGSLALGLGGLMYPTWWIGSAIMLPAVAIVGLLIVRKTRRFDIFLTFLVVALAGIVGVGMYYQSTFVEVIKSAFTSWPLIFFGTIMLTEPLTSPPVRKLRMVYAVVVGLLFSIPFHIGSVYSTPEMALVIGNIFSYIVSPKQKLILALKEKIQLAPMVYDFVFAPNEKMAFTAGQYMEWTLAHSKSDTRGIRRFFTIASAPTENEIHLGVKMAKESSTFKKALLNLNAGDKLIAGQLSGDFTLPKDKSKKIVAVAGGVGITPFRSMVKEMIDTGDKRDLVLFYMSADPAEFVYKDILNAGQVVGVKTVYVLSGSSSAWQGKTGFLTADLVKAEVPDFQDRIYYLSGPPAMVKAYKKLLLSMGISRTAIKTDYFPGY